ncbi:hypothetical protein [Aestuariivirga sp.]|uniref:hypothetical protein n=1 Tax=Aestuariivirga sp. TaxID=2650926 RepID=UPI0039E4185E
MLKLCRAVAIAATAAVLAAGPALAQVKIMVPTVRVAPTVKVAPVPTVRVAPPTVRIIPPSMALRNIKQIMPQVQILNVAPRGAGYVVKVKDGATVRQIRVDGATGAVSP